mmetsp:Transcript_13899/g.23942  ORF Transcript_13899/g.23942 Transcript_13899/m.23942 type:complete len:639 (+) Transcript_13899:13-1929(+)
MFKTCSRLSSRKCSIRINRLRPIRKLDSKYSFSNRNYVTTYTTFGNDTKTFKIDAQYDSEGDLYSRMELDEKTGFPKPLLERIHQEINSFEDAKRSLARGIIPLDDSKKLTKQELSEAEAPDVFLQVAQKVLDRRLKQISDLNEKGKKYAKERQNEEDTDASAEKTLGADDIFKASHAGFIFEYPPAELNKYLPEGVDPLLLDTFERLGAARLMYRESTHKIIEKLKALKENNFLPEKEQLTALSTDGNVAELAPGSLYERKRDALGNVIRDEPEWKTRNKQASVFAPSSALLLLDGQTGSGRSTTLLQTVYWARASGWIVVYEPDCRQLMDGGRTIQESWWAPGQYDQNDLASTRLLPALLTAHEAQLADLHVQTRFGRTLLARRRDVAAAGEDETDADTDAADKPDTKVEIDYDDKTSLLALAKLGLAAPHIAAACYSTLLRELAAQTSVPVMIALDGINLLSYDSLAHADMYGKPPESIIRIKMGRQYEHLKRRGEDIYDGEVPKRGPPIYWDKKVPREAIPRGPKGGEPLGAGQLTIASTFCALESTGLSNGVLVGCTSRFREAAAMYEHGNADIRRAATLEVPVYNQAELNTVLSDYQAKGLVLNELTGQEIDYVKQFSAFRPKEVANLASLL